MASPRNRGRPYGVMLLVAFATAVVGVMVVQKLRERRVYNILINEKDREIMALNTRYQREKGFSKELKRKIEDMKAKIESLKNQKFELNSKLSEMQSLTTSLQEKHRTLGAEVEEKQKQIEFLRGKKGLSRKMYLQLIALRETLKQKEDEIHELKRRNSNVPSEHSGGFKETVSFPSHGTDIKSILDKDNSTDRDQHPVSKGQQDEHNQNLQAGEDPRPGDQSEGISADGANSTKERRANVEVVNNETLPDAKVNNQTEHARIDAIKTEENVNAGNKLPLDETSRIVDGIQMPIDTRLNADYQRGKVENGDVRLLVNRENGNAEIRQDKTNENAERRQGEGVTLLTDLEQPEQPENSQNATEERQPEDKEAEKNHLDGLQEALHNGNVIKEQENNINTIRASKSDVQAADRRENIEDVNVQHHEGKDESVDAKGLENGDAAHEFRQSEVQQSNPETEGIKDTEIADDGDAFDESKDDIAGDERRDSEPENYQDDKDGEEVSEM